MVLSQHHKVEGLLWEQAQGTLVGVKYVRFDFV